MEKDGMRPSSLAKTIPGLSGIGAGVITALVCSPLDVAKMRIMVQDCIPGHRQRYQGTIPTLAVILKEEGFRGWYRGITPALISIPLFWGCFFTAYDVAKTNLKAWTGRDQHILAAASAGGFTDVVTNPFWVVRTRMQTHVFHARNGAPEATMLQTFRTICRNEGLLSLYRGLTASFLGLSHIAIQLPVYEKLKAMARARNRDGTEHASDLVGASIVSKVCGALVSYPHEVLRARMQDDRGGIERERRGVVAIAKGMIKEEGVGSLYVGFRINLIRVVPGCVATFLSYEIIARHLRKRFRVPEPASAPKKEAAKPIRVATAPASAPT